MKWPFVRRSTYEAEVRRNASTFNSQCALLAEYAFRLDDVEQELVDCALAAQDYKER